MTTRLDDLDPAFELPEAVTDARLRSLYEVLVHRMREEARTLPMNTVQQLLIERIATNYIILRAREAGDMGGFSNASSQKEFNSFWLAMTQEFNRLLCKVEPVSGADRKALMREMQQIITQTVSTVADPRVRAELLNKLAAAFQTAGI